MGGEHGAGEADGEGVEDEEEVVEAQVEACKDTPGLTPALYHGGGCGEVAGEFVGDDALGHGVVLQALAHDRKYRGNQQGRDEGNEEDALPMLMGDPAEGMGGFVNGYSWFCRAPGEFICS